MYSNDVVINAINACNSVKALKLYMETCAKCGTCAKVCPVYYGEPPASTTRPGVQTSFGASTRSTTRSGGSCLDRSSVPKT